MSLTQEIQSDSQIDPLYLSSLVQNVHEAEQAFPTKISPQDRVSDSFNRKYQQPLDTARAALTMVMTDVLLESGMEEQVTADTTDLEAVRKTKAGRRIITDAITVAVTTTRLSKEDAQNPATDEDVELIEKGATLLSGALGIGKIALSNADVATDALSSTETAEEEPYSGIEIDRDTFAELQAIEKLPTLEAVKKLAPLFLDTHHANQILLDSIDAHTIGQHWNEEYKSRQELQALATMNMYARSLSDVITHIAADKQEAFASLLGQAVEHESKRRIRAAFEDGDTKTQMDLRDSSVNFEKMLTGVRLEIASGNALTETADKFGWKDVRPATVEEDIHYGRDYIVTLADGTEVAIDVKSHASFQKQHLTKQYTSAVGIKRTATDDKEIAGGNRVLVVDAQALVGPTGKNGFVLSDKLRFASTVNYAMTQHLTDQS